MNLNLGSGRGLPGYVNVDIKPSYGGRPDVIADGHFLPFKDKSFETVVIKDVLSVVRDWRVVLAEAQRVSSQVLVVDHSWPQILWAMRLKKARQQWPQWSLLWGLKKRWYLGNIFAEIHCP